MALSRGTSNGPDWRDVTQAIVNYELLWQCRITLSIHLDGSDGVRYLMVEAKAEFNLESSGVPLHSVCVTSTMRQLNVQTLSAAMLNLLHKLDREIEVVKPLGS